VVGGEDWLVNRPELSSAGLPVSDLRWLRMEEFLNSSNLSLNSRKVYQRELKRFLGWTDHAWFDLKPRHLALYKAYLSEEVQTAQGKPLEKSSINSASATLKSFFGWLMQCYPDWMRSNPTVGVKFEKLSLPLAQGLTAQEMRRVWAVLEQLGETKPRDLALMASAQSWAASWGDCGAECRGPG